MSPEDFDIGFNQYTQPKDRGVVRVIGVRKGNAVHSSVERVEVTVDGGITGDRWARGEDPQRHSQITLMSSAVGELIANAERAGFESGDNFYVELDLSADNLPVGSRLRIGTVLLEVTWKPHRGCKKFVARFGEDVMSWVALPSNASRRLRGIHCEVLAPGTVAVGDLVEVVSR